AIAKYAARPARAVEACEGEHLAGDEALGFRGVHRFWHFLSQRRNRHRRRHRDTQNKTHDATPRLARDERRAAPLPTAYHTNCGDNGAPSLEKSERRHETLTTIRPRTVPERMPGALASTSSSEISCVISV